MLTRLRRDKPRSVAIRPGVWCHGRVSRGELAVADARAKQQEQRTKRNGDDGSNEQPNRPSDGQQGFTVAVAVRLSSGGTSEMIAAVVAVQEVHGSESRILFFTEKKTPNVRKN